MLNRKPFYYFDNEGRKKYVDNQDFNQPQQ